MDSCEDTKDSTSFPLYFTDVFTGVPTLNSAVSELTAALLQALAHEVYTTQAKDGITATKFEPPQLPTLSLTARGPESDTSSGSPLVHPRPITPQDFINLEISEEGISSLVRTVTALFWEALESKWDPEIIKALRCLMHGVGLDNFAYCMLVYTKEFFHEDTSDETCLYFCNVFWSMYALSFPFRQEDITDAADVGPDPSSPSKKFTPIPDPRLGPDNTTARKVFVTCMGWALRPDGPQTSLCTWIRRLEEDVRGNSDILGYSQFRKLKFMPVTARDRMLNISACIHYVLWPLVHSYESDLALDSDPSLDLVELGKASTRYSGAADSYDASSYDKILCPALMALHESILTILNEVGNPLFQNILSQVDVIFDHWTDAYESDSYQSVPGSTLSSDLIDMWKFPVIAELVSKVFLEACKIRSVHRGVNTATVAQCLLLLVGASGSAMLVNTMEPDLVQTAMQCCSKTPLAAALLLATTNTLHSKTFAMPRYGINLQQLHYQLDFVLTRPSMFLLEKGRTLAGIVLVLFRSVEARTGDTYSNFTANPRWRRGIMEAAKSLMYSDPVIRILVAECMPTSMEKGVLEKGIDVLRAAVNCLAALLSDIEAPQELASVSTSPFRAVSDRPTDEACDVPVQEPDHATPSFCRALESLRASYNALIDTVNGVLGTSVFNCITNLDILDQFTEKMGEFLPAHAPEERIATACTVFNALIALKNAARAIDKGSMRRSCFQLKGASLTCAYWCLGFARQQLCLEAQGMWLEITKLCSKLISRCDTWGDESACMERVRVVSMFIDPDLVERSLRCSVTPATSSACTPFLGSVSPHHKHGGNPISLSHHTEPTRDTGSPCVPVQFSTEPTTDGTVHRPTFDSSRGVSQRTVVEGVPLTVNPREEYGVTSETTARHTTSTPLPVTRDGDGSFQLRMVDHPNISYRTNDYSTPPLTVAVKWAATRLWMELLLTSGSRFSPVQVSEQEVGLDDTWHGDIRSRADVLQALSKGWSSLQVSPVSKCFRGPHWEDTLVLCICMSLGGPSWASISERLPRFTSVYSANDFRDFLGTYKEWTDTEVRAFLLTSFITTAYSKGPFKAFITTDPHAGLSPSDLFALYSSLGPKLVKAAQSEQILTLGLIHCLSLAIELEELNGGEGCCGCGCGGCGCGECKCMNPMVAMALTIAGQLLHTPTWARGDKDLAGCISFSILHLLDVICKWFPWHFHAALLAIKRDVVMVGTIKSEKTWAVGLLHCAMFAQLQYGNGKPEGDVEARPWGRYTNVLGKCIKHSVCTVDDLRPLAIDVMVYHGFRVNTLLLYLYEELYTRKLDEFNYGCSSSEGSSSPGSKSPDAESNTRSGTEDESGKECAL